MKQGKTLSQLAIELDRQQNAKRDFVADSRKLTVLDDGRLAVGGNGEFETNKLFENQLSSHCDIPRKYWDKMPGNLRAINANHWLQNDPAKRMVRTLAMAA